MNSAGRALRSLGSRSAPATRREQLILYQLSAISYLGCVALLGFALLRAANFENPVTLSLYGITPWLYTPVYAVVGFAFRARKPLLAALSIAVVIVHLVTIWPDIKPADHLSAAVKSAPRLRVFSSNVLDSNADISRIIDEALASNADIAVFEEVNHSHLKQLLDNPGLAALPNRVYGDNSDTAIFSRLPIESSDIWTKTYRPMARALFSTAIGPVELVAVHTVAPINRSSIHRWRQMLVALRDFAQVRTTPLLLVGDFNATVYHPRFEDILDTGLTDAHSARGAGLTGTWPRNKPIPPFLRIDHALSSKELVPISAKYGTGTGSDHRPIIVDYALVGSNAK